ncbi:MAG TPA: ribonuclease HI family protein [Ardenticatenaceae bacterium]|nr:ribonuclease HI family protein [Ardenticatenaceae bacterium]
MSPELLLQAILELSRADQARLFALIREHPRLQRQLRPESVPAAAVEESVREPEDGTPEPVAVAPARPAANGFDYLLIFDGGSKGNPGKGYGSYALHRTATGQKRVERLDFPGRLTNNEAEYQTLIAALETLLGKLREHGRDPKDFSIEVRGDSQLVIFQVQGKWKAKDDRMAGYRDRARALLGEFGRHQLTHHLREKSVRELGH